MKKLLENPFVKKVLIGLGLLAVLLLVIDNIIMPLYVSAPESVVPSVVGMFEVEAFEALKEQDFEPVIADTTFGVSQPPGKIFLQKPEAGKVVKEGRTVYLFISGGDQTISVPQLKGKSVLDARFALERIGLRLGEIEEATSTNPKDMIFDQQFEEGTMLRKSQSVGVTVSIGKGFGEIEVPDLIGKSLTEARRVLADSSLKVGKINFQFSNTLLPNTILDQYPAPGNKLNSGEAVDLFITREGAVQERIEYPE